jgi:predicted TIM-barrel fold metal-dependent hydrolase
MAANGIDRSVILPVATKPSQVPTINSISIQNNTDIVTFFGTLHPDSTDFVSEIARLKQSGIKGVKLHPEYQGFYIADKKYYPIYDALQDAEILVTMHTGKDPGPFASDHALPQAVKTLIKDFPRLRLIAAHMGGWRLWDMVEQELAGENIFFDTAAIYGIIDPALFVRLVRKHGAERILFASDSPWFDLGVARNWIDAQPLTSSEKEKIFFANANALLNG